MNTEPRNVCFTPPKPPLTDVPPMTTAETMLRNIVLPRLDIAAWFLALSSTDSTDAYTAESRNIRKIVLFTLMPEMCAAFGVVPTA